MRLGLRSPAVLLRDPRATNGCGESDGRRGGRAVALLRRSTRAGIAGREFRNGSAPSNRFPPGADSLRRRISGRLDRRTLSDRSGGCRCNVESSRWKQTSSSSAPRRFPATRIAISTCSATFSDQRFKHILVPVWLLTYVYGAKSYQVVINGVTGTDRRRTSLELDQDHAAGDRRAAVALYLLSLAER